MSLFHAEAAEADQTDRGELQGLVQFAFMRRPLAELLSACADAPLELIVLKGAALAETLYPRPSLRPFGDLDVLVRRADAPRAFALLSELGYTAEAAAWADLLRDRSFEANFFRDTGTGPVVIELHTSLLNNSLFFSYLLDLDALWARAVPARLAGQPARVLGPEDLMLHLCLHLAGHYLAAPRSLRDIFQLCDAAGRGAETLDWPLFLRLAYGARAEIACFCSLYAAKELLQASVPGEVLDALAPPKKPRQRMEALASARAADPEHTEYLRLPLLWRLMGGSRARLGAARRILFPAPRWLILHYYYDLFDSGAPPAAGSVRYFAVLFVLSLVHAGSLLRRSLGVLLRRRV